MNWRAVPEVGTMLGLRFVAGTLHVFGRRVTAITLWFICWYYVLVGAVARRASRDFLGRLGHPTDLKHIHRHFWTFARVATDRLLFLSGRTRDLTVNLHNHEQIMNVARSKRGALLLGAHLGSFEAMRAMASEYDVPLVALVDFRNAKRINTLLSQLSPNLRVRVLEVDPASPTGVLAVKEAIDRGELVAMLADRRTNRPGRDVAVPFLGGMAQFPIGPFVLAHLLECPVFFVCALFESPSTYQVHCEPLFERLELPRRDRQAALFEAASRAAAVLERFTRQSALNWFNFFPFWVDS